MIEKKKTFGDYCQIFHDGFLAIAGILGLLGLVGGLLYALYILAEQSLRDFVFVMIVFEKVTDQDFTEEDAAMSFMVDNLILISKWHSG